MNLKQDFLKSYYVFIVDPKIYTGFITQNTISINTINIKETRIKLKIRYVICFLLGNCLTIIVIK
jgi:hypothetical protein